MNEQKINGRGIFYGVIGVATLVVAIIGATFAYFTATKGVNDVIKGNMATVSLGLDVEKVTTVDVTKGGMIPMSNGMVEGAINTVESGNPACVDDNGNAICQVYKITVTNSSTAGQFVDGYVTLFNGSGEPTDIKAMTPNYSYTNKNDTNAGTSMRWAQVFAYTAKKAASGTNAGDANANGWCEATEKTCTPETDTPEVTYYSTGGTQYLSDSDASGVPITAIGDMNNPHNQNNIKIALNDVLLTTAENKEKPADDQITIGDNFYDIIDTNFVRLSDHDKTSTTYKRATDVTSALVFNHSISGNTTGDDDNNVSVNYYFVVWLSETGTDQTAGSSGAGAAASAANFFGGNVRFVSAQGSEVSATFSGYTRVPATYVEQ